MVKIKALRQFSHFHAGNFSQGDERTVSESTAKALVGMGLAERVNEKPKEQEKPQTKRRVKNDD